MLKNLHKKTDINLLRPKELIWIECFSLDRCSPVYALNKNLTWKSFKELDNRTYTNKEHGKIDIYKMAIAYMSDEGNISQTVSVFGGYSIPPYFHDLSYLIDHEGFSRVSMGYFSGNKAAYEATRIAIGYTHHDDQSKVDDAMKIMILFKMHPYYSLLSIASALILIESCANKEADVVFYAQCNGDMKIDEVGVTVVAAGLQRESKLCNRDCENQ